MEQPKKSVAMDDTFLLIITSKPYTGSRDRAELYCRVPSCKGYVVTINDDGAMCEGHARQICFEPGCDCCSVDLCQCSDDGDGGHAHELDNPFDLNN